MCVSLCHVCYSGGIVCVSVFVSMCMYICVCLSVYGVCVCVGVYEFFKTRQTCCQNFKGVHRGSIRWVHEGGS